jgi:hypothetical protein
MRAPGRTMRVVTKRWLSSRALLHHVELLVVAAGCAAATWWQADRALSGNSLSWFYTFEWPVFIGIAGRQPALGDAGAVSDAVLRVRVHAVAQTPLQAEHRDRRLVRDSIRRPPALPDPARMVLHTTGTSAG